MRHVLLAFAIVACSGAEFGAGDGILGDAGGDLGPAPSIDTGSGGQSTTTPDAPALEAGGARPAASGGATGSGGGIVAAGGQPAADAAGADAGPAAGGGGGGAGGSPHVDAGPEPFCIQPAEGCVAEHNSPCGNSYPTRPVRYLCTPPPGIFPMDYDHCFALSTTYYCCEDIACGE